SACAEDLAHAADPDGRGAARLRHPQRHHRRGHRARPAAAAHRPAIVDAAPGRGGVGRRGRSLVSRDLAAAPGQALLPGGVRMIALKPYARPRAQLADYLLWAGLVAPGVVLNKDGAFQRTLEFRGPDLDSATPGELMGATARLNNALRRFGSGWCIHVEARLRPAPNYPDAEWPCALAWLIDQERRQA